MQSIKHQLNDLLNQSLNLQISLNEYTTRTLQSPEQAKRINYIKRNLNSISKEFERLRDNAN